MTAGVLEKDVSEPKKKRGRDRMGVMLKPHVRMRLDRMAEDEDQSQMGMIRTLVLEALAARGYPENVLLADWHEEISESLRSGTPHPYSLDSKNR